MGESSVTGLLYLVQYSGGMSTRYRTSAANRDGGDGTTTTSDGWTVRVSSPLSPDPDPSATNPEQLLALAWATCLNATAQAVVKGVRATAVRVEVALRDAEGRDGYEFTADAFVSGEGMDAAETASLAAAAHARCPVSRLLHASPLISVQSEPYSA